VRLVTSSRLALGRFLAEDASKRLDHVLDTILAALVHRQKNLRR
jgi:hypothetical protein